MKIKVTLEFESIEELITYFENRKPKELVDSSSLNEWVNNFQRDWRKFARRHELPIRLTQSIRRGITVVDQEWDYDKRAWCRVEPYLSVYEFMNPPPTFYEALNDIANDRIHVRNIGLIHSMNRLA